MRTVLATIETPNRSVDLELSGDIAIGELIPALVVLFGVAMPERGLPATAAAWGLGQRGGKPLPVGRTLISCDVVDGARLALLPAMVWTAQQNQGTQSMPQTTPSAQDTGGIGIRWRRDGLL